MAYNYDPNRPSGGDNSDLISWIIVIATLVVVWPVGLFLLFRKLMGYPLLGGSTSERHEQGRHPYDIEQDKTAGAGPYRTSAHQEQSPSYSKSASQGAPGQNASPGGTGYKYGYRYQYQAGAQAAPKAPSAPRAQATPRAPAAPRQAQGCSSQPGMQGVPYQPRRRNVDLNKGKGMTVWGSILTGIFGLGAITTLPIILLERDIVAFFGAGAPILGFLCLGLVLLYTGGQRNKKAKRFRKYLALIGRRDSIAISSLAQAMPVSYHTACDDLQEMLDERYIPTGYLDMNSGRLILSDAGLNEETPEPEEAVKEEIKTVEEPGRTEEDDNAILEEIRQVNDSIADLEMTRKINRIGEITGKILDYQRKNPNKNSQLRSFLSYYLPTTLKILKAYAQMEAQGIEGENIRAAKERIEGMMDKVVEGFEKQLDKLFQDDAMDITTDVEVLERMLDKDGLSGGEGFQLGL